VGTIITFSRMAASAVGRRSISQVRGAKIPGRPFLGVNAHDEERIGDFLMEYLAKL
jgi:phage gpG-like protein